MTTRFFVYTRRLAMVLLALAAMVAGAPVSSQAPSPSCPASQVAGAHDYHGLSLSRCSFNGLDLSNANFQGATLTSVVFIRTNLTQANFTGAVFADSGNATLPTDFSFANLTGAKFTRAKFNGPTYLTYSNLACADFSSTNLATGLAIFGDQPLVLATAGSCRTSFQNTTMNCEFVPQWDQLDLTNANIAACNSLLQTRSGNTGYDFSGGLYAGVVFDGLDLTGSKWTGAVLERASFQGATLDNASGLSGTAANPSRLSAAKFNNASVQNVDLSNAQLYGAQFANANVSNSSFAGSFLSANTAAVPHIENAASFDGAHLKNVNLANAKLQGATFQFASFYGSFGGATPTPCATSCARPGFTCACATASGADLTGTNFSNAFLYGVDFSGTTTIDGTLFGSAILTGATFAGVKFQQTSQAAPDFTKALLQGATFDSTANLVNVSLLNAFVDFGAPGNSGAGNFLYLRLSSAYTGFKGWSGAPTPCVSVAYANFTVAPANVTMVCPHGISTTCGDGKNPASIANWMSKITMAGNAIPGWYTFDATYDKGWNDPPPYALNCGNNVKVDPKW